MRTYPTPKLKLPFWVGPEDDGSIDCPDCEESDSGKCALHDDSVPSLMDDPDKLAEEDFDAYSPSWGKLRICVPKPGASHD